MSGDGRYGQLDSNIAMQRATNSNCDNWPFSSIPPLVSGVEEPVSGLQKPDHRSRRQGATFPRKTRVKVFLAGVRSARAPRVRRLQRNSVAVMARQIDTADHTTANVRKIHSPHQGGL
jgi:hypothetical protein